KQKGHLQLSKYEQTTPRRYSSKVLGASVLKRHRQDESVDTAKLFNIDYKRFHMLTKISAKIERDLAENE
nr:hypothetical protein [Tanacetum cinerariifolium]